MGSELTVRTTYEAPGPGPAGLTWDGTLLWNADFRSGGIFGWDPATGSPVHSLRCPGNLSGLAWDGQSLWQSLYDEAMVRRINPETNDFDQTLILTEYGWLSGVAWDGSRLWVLAQQTGQLLALDPENGQVVRQIETPVAGGDMDFHDGHLWLSVAAPMQFDPTVEQFDWLSASPAYALLKIDPSDGRVVEQVVTQRLYSGLAWVDNTLWLASALEGNLVAASLNPA